MKNINKKDIIKDICNKKHWDIREIDATSAIKHIADRKCKKYSTMHYKMVYRIIEAKVEQIEDPIEKIAYIDCLIMNYADLGSDKYNKILDIASALSSGSYLGISIFKDIKDLETIAITVVLLFIFQLLKAINLMFRKWNFYQMILKQLKSDIM